MPTNKGKKTANLEAALALGGRPKRGVMAVTTTTTLRRSVRGVAPTAPAAAVTVPGGAAPAVAAAATDRTSSWCNTIAGSRPSINTGHNLNIHDAATLPVPATLLDDKCSSFSSEDDYTGVQFWKFAKNLHPCLDDETITIITDQAKGLIESIREVLPNAVHFHCSYHRRQNITKYVRGGNVKYSALWLFNKLVKARSKREIDQIKHLHAPFMDNKALKYLNTLPDEQQYPGARCDVGAGHPKVFMNMHEASSSVESMNKANNPARARTAVDAVCSTHLLVQMCSMRYQAKKDEAWKWEDTLTPYGNKLRDAAFEDINYRHYRINIEEGEEKWICRVTRLGKGISERTCFFLKYIEQDSVFGGCSCGLPYTDGVPCHHMVAVVKSSRIEGLTASNAMPYWWTTECWRNQFPVDTNVTCNFDMELLRATPEDGL
jgi:hypothetical protein